MGNKLATIVSTFVVLISFVLLVAFISTDEQIDKSTQLIQEFGDTVRYKGYITHDEYINLVNNIPYKNFKVQMTHGLNTTDKVYTPGTLNMRFSAQILGTEDQLDKGYKIRTTNGKTIYSGTLLYNGSEVIGQITTNML